MQQLMQMQQRHALLPYTYCCGLCGEPYYSDEPPSIYGEVCDSCKEFNEKEMNICPTCGEPCGIEDELCKECMDRAVCYAEMPAPRES